MKTKPHSIRIEHPNIHGNTDAGCRITIEGLFPRKITLLEREIEGHKGGWPLLIEDLTYIVQLEWGYLRMFKAPNHVHNTIDNVLEEGTVAPVDFYQAFIGDSSAFVRALNKYCDIVVKDCIKRHGTEDLLARDWVRREEGGERVFRTDILNSFRRRDNKRIHRRPLWLMEILNHENFHGGYVYPDDGSDAYELSPWQTLKHWHRSLRPDQWQRLLERINLILLDGGHLYCHAGEDRRGEINFRWAGMFGGIILRGEEWSSHT